MSRSFFSIRGPARSSKSACRTSNWQNSTQARGSKQFWKVEKSDFSEHGTGWRAKVQDDKAVPTQWETKFLPFPATADSKPGITHATLMFGGKKQTMTHTSIALDQFFKVPGI